MIRRILKSRKLKKSAIKEDSSDEESNFNSEEESCEEIEKYMKTLGKISKKFVKKKKDFFFDLSFFFYFRFKTRRSNARN